MKSLYLLLIMVSATSLILSCATAQPTPDEAIKAENEAFLKAPSFGKEEVFRVLVMSDTYQITQTAAKETISRLEDKGGDQFMVEDLAKNDKINEAREAIYTVSLYPDSGRIYQIRPKRLSNLLEIDHLIVQDIQRWNIVHPSGKKMEVSPLKFDVYYRVVLRKKISDEAILQEKRDALKDKIGH
jgi:hypothetical protein